LQLGDYSVESEDCTPPAERSEEAFRAVRLSREQLKMPALPPAKHEPPSPLARHTDPAQRALVGEAWRERDSILALIYIFLLYAAISVAFKFLS